jgi:hypothetical protein
MMARVRATGRAMLRLSTGVGERILLGRYHLAPPAASPETMARRVSGGRVAPIGSNDFLPALSRNLSPYGIAIECEQIFPVGTPLQLRFREPFWPGNRQVVGTICHVSKDESGPAHLGLKFNPELALSLENNIIPFVRKTVNR